MRFWFDTEFIDNGTIIDLISIGVIAEDGRAFYAESAECNLGNACEWVKANVIPQLTGHTISRAEIAQGLVDFLGEKPEIWAFYCSYDWVAFSQLFGRMIDLPKGWPHFCLDVKQLAVSMGDPRLPAQITPPHQAMNDAIWTSEAWWWLHDLQTELRNERQA